MSYGIFAADDQRECSRPELSPTFATEGLAWEAIYHYMRELDIPMTACAWKVKPVADVRRVPRFEQPTPPPEIAARVAELEAADAAQPQRKPNCFDLLRKAWAEHRTLPTNSAERKEFPLSEGCFRYIPAALAAFAGWSKQSNDKHNPGEPLHHARGKSMDHEDCLLRHTIDAGDPAADKLEELTARFWRAGIELQQYAESLGAPMAPNAKESRK